ncbi:23189_t:CDS:2, partial [Cetraspora pellucida]
FAVESIKIKKGPKWPLLEEALWLWVQEALSAEMDLNNRILQKKAIHTININNITTRIQNNTIIINQYSTITSIQNSTITKKLTSLHDYEIQLAKQEFLTEHMNEVNVIQNSIN